MHRKKRINIYGVLYYPLFQAPSGSRGTHPPLIRGDNCISFPLYPSPKGHVWQWQAFRNIPLPTLSGEQSPCTLCCFLCFSGLGPYPGILSVKVREPERQRAYLHPTKRTVCRCCKFKEVVFTGGVFAWSGGERGREQRRKGST